MRESSKAISGPWGECETVRLPNGILGGHAFGESKALHALEDGTHFVAGGERYSTTDHWLQWQHFAYNYWRVQLAPFQFSLHLNLINGRLIGLVASPLYYAHTPSRILFCSRLRLGEPLLDGGWPCRNQSACNGTISLRTTYATPADIYTVDLMLRK
jgi:hypothetical protein